MFYEPRVATLCDICEGEDCGNTCTSRRDPRTGERLTDGSAEPGASAALSPSALGLLLAVIASLTLARILAPAA